MGYGYVLWLIVKDMDYIIVITEYNGYILEVELNGILIVIINVLN